MNRRGGGGFGNFSPPGPPAPVPEAVAMPRPSAEEVATINAELQKFINMEDWNLFSGKGMNPSERSTCGMGGLTTQLFISSWKAG